MTFRRMKDDVLAGLKLTERKAIDPAHPRRALTMEEIGHLLTAAEQRPPLELRIPADQTMASLPLPQKFSALFVAVDGRK